ncbi:MAG: hypothetical protein ABFD92_18765 [Planctomycetaceae bacterium]|nr:hypothetical protein [Planctomycetaceae bacterium]
MRTARHIIAAVLVAALCAGAFGRRLLVAADGDVPVSSAAGAKAPARLHLPQTRRVNMVWETSDGASCRWDIQASGNIGQGANNAYSGGMYCQIWGSNLGARGFAWSNDAGDEIEIGPSQMNSITFSRRIKVYKDRGLARWLEIFENNSSSEVVVPVSIYTCTNYNIGQTLTSTGGATFGAKDSGFVTQSQGGPNVPSLLHLVCSPNADVLPSVTVQGNQIYVRYNLRIAAGMTVVLCHFESQNNSTTELSKLMKGFQIRPALRDLPEPVRNLIVNWKTGGALEGLDLDRSTTADTVIEGNDDRKFGTILNKNFTLQTLYGPVTLDAAKVVGMVRLGSHGDRVRVATTDGQVICGQARDAGGPQSLSLELSAGGTLAIPIDRLTEWSYRISKARPQESPFAGPMAVLRSGDCLAFDAAALTMKFQTRYGTVDLEGATLASVDLDSEDGGVHRAMFLNGSVVGGLLLGDELTLPLRLGRPLTVRRDMIKRLVFAEEVRENPELSRAVLTNGDQLLGRLETPKIVLETQYGPAEPPATSVMSMEFSKSHVGWCKTLSWDGSTLRGLLSEQRLAFRIVPGPVLTVHVGQFVSIQRPAAIPPDKVVAVVDRHLAQLGAESYKDRQAAREALMQMGKNIVPLLKVRLGKASDPEVRTALEAIIESLGGGEEPNAPQPMLIPQWGVLQCG